MTRENELTSILRPFQSHSTNRMSHEQSSRLAAQLTRQFYNLRHMRHRTLGYEN